MQLVYRNLNFIRTLTYTLFFFFKQKTAYEMRISDWSSDVCSSDLALVELPTRHEREPGMGTGMGGDETTAIDLAAENAAVARLEELHAGGLEFTDRKSVV